MGMGLLTFTADGRMMAALSDGRPGPIDGRRAFVSYCGDYTFDGARLVTRVDGASDPLFLSEPQVRDASLEGNRLTLRPPVGFRGAERPRAGTRLGADFLVASRRPTGERLCPIPKQPLRVGVGGPVGSGKTALMEQLCKRLRDRLDIAAITNDIYTKEDARILVEAGALPPERIMGVETGGCPHTAIREDASINLAAIADMRKRFPDLDVILIESGGDNLAATFSPELADLTIYVIDVSGGEKIPRKGGPGITRSDLLVINKIDLAPFVGASLEVMARDAAAQRKTRPFVMANMKTGEGRRPGDRVPAREGRAGGLSRRCPDACGARVGSLRERAL